MLIGKMKNTHNNLALTANKIKKMIGIELSKEEQELEKAFEASELLK